MPESAEVKLMANAIAEIVKDHQLQKIIVLGGRYRVYQIQDEKGQWINRLPDPKTGKLMPIKPDKYPGGQYSVTLENIDTFNSLASRCAPSPQVNTKGKFCWIEFPWADSACKDPIWYIGFTFGMTGSIYYEPTPEVLHEHSERTGKAITKEQYMANFHIQFVTNNSAMNSNFYFGDTRHWGTVTLSNDRAKLRKKVSNLGLDILDDPTTDNPSFAALCRAGKYRQQNICKLLMGQEVISGVGNYIKAEALYECQINPYAWVSDLDDTILQSLRVAVHQIAHAALRGHGASLYTYTGTRKEKGTFQEALKVYNRVTDLHGNIVRTIVDNKENMSILPDDKRTIHYVPAIQIIGDHRDPNRIQAHSGLVPTKVKLSLKSQAAPAKVKLQLKHKVQLP